MINTHPASLGFKHSGIVRSHCGFGALKRTARLVALPLILCLVAVCARAETLLEENFDELPERGLSSDGPVRQWTGPSVENQYGVIEAASETTPNGAGNSARFRDFSSEKNKASVLTAKWMAPEGKAVSVEWKFMIPVPHPFLGIYFLGANWSDSPAVVILENEKIVLESGEGKRQQIGQYATGEWHTLKVVNHVSTQVVDVFLDGQKVANGFPWRKMTGQPSTDALSVVADMSEEDRAGTPVFYMDDIKVSTEP